MCLYNFELVSIKPDRLGIQPTDTLWLTKRHSYHCIYTTKLITNSITDHNECTKNGELRDDKILNVIELTIGKCVTKLSSVIKMLPKEKWIRMINHYAPWFGCLLPHYFLKYSPFQTNGLVKRWRAVDCMVSICMNFGTDLGRLGWMGILLGV